MKERKKAPAGGAKDKKQAKYPTSADYARINAAARGCLDRIAQHFAPGGKMEGREYVALNPTRPDSSTGSFKINLDTGLWSDFAEEHIAKGGDAVSFVSYLLGAAHQSEGLRALADFLGMAAVEGDHPGTGAAAPAFKLSEPKPEEPRPLMPVPPEAMATKPTAHPSHGKPSQVWEYRDAAGNLLFEIWRFDPPGKRKQFSPLSYWPDGTWKWKGCPAPRPLYGLDRLAARPQAPVLLAEGERAADAACWLLPDHVCITTANGAASPEKSDFNPLAGRIVRIWRDNDEPGAKYAKTCARLALEAGAAAVELLDLAALAVNPLTGEACELPKGWDAADANARGWTVKTLADRLVWKPARIKPQAPAAELSGAVGQLPDPAAIKSGAELPDGYEVIEPGDPSRREPGVYFTQIKHRKEGGPDNGPHDTVERLWLSSSMWVTAEVRDHGGHDWGKLLEFTDPDGTPHRIIIPRALLAGTGEPARALVHAHGAEVSTAAEQQRRWKDYLLKSRPPARARITSKSGWHPGGVFVLGNARTFGPAGHESVLFQADGAEPPAYATAGTLEDWRANVGTLAVGNSRVEFSLCLPFAATLLELTGDESGGFHLRGKEYDASSSGKTTTERAAVSIMGGPDLLKPWRTTSNAVEGTAESFSGLLLALDEIAQMDAKEGAATIYGLGNGVGKIRASRTGEPRPPKKWRLLFLSSGEISLEEHLKSADKQYRQGLGARFVELPADAGAGMGCFESLHGEKNAAAFARSLQAAAAKYYGTPLVHWLEYLTANRDKIAALIPGMRAACLAQLLAKHPQPSGLVRRVADRFALVGIAGELARDAGILPWPERAAWNAARRLFDEWLQDRGGAGNVEAAALVDRVRGLLLSHSEGKFTNLLRANDPHKPTTPGRWGFFSPHLPKLNPDDEGGLVRPNPLTLDEAEEGGELRRHVLTRSLFLVFPQSFKDELIGGADPTEAARILTAVGVLKPGKKRPTRQVRLPGFKNGQWVYLLSLDHEPTEGGPS